MVLDNFMPGIVSYRFVGNVGVMSNDSGSELAEMTSLQLAARPNSFWLTFRAAFFSSESVRGCSEFRNSSPFMQTNYCKFIGLCIDWEAFPGHLILLILVVHMHRHRISAASVDIMDQ